MTGPRFQSNVPAALHRWRSATPAVTAERKKTPVSAAKQPRAFSMTSADGRGDRQRQSLNSRSGPSIRALDQGISTVSTTWITPFDCITSAIVTIDLPPLASVSITRLPISVAVSGSP